MNPTDPHEDKDDPTEEGPPGETLAERSRRLEEEAAKGSYDPLAPDPLLPSALEAQEDTGAEPGEDVVPLSELVEMREQLMRAVAEAENTRKRAKKEREDAGKFAISNFTKDLLDVSDNLRRALEAVPTDLLDTEPRLKNLVEGIEATERELLRAFGKHGVQPIDPGEEQFDPNFHEVMMEVPGTGKPPGTIVQVMEIGYILNDRLLRPARVGVAKDDGSAPPPQEAPDPGGHIDTEA